MQHVMFLSWNLEFGVYICQKLKNTGKCAAEVCAKGINKIPKIDHGSMLGRNRFGTKMRKLNEPKSLSTICFGCWTWTASKTTENDTSWQLMIYIYIYIYMRYNHIIWDKTNGWAWLGLGRGGEGVYIYIYI